MTINEIKDFLLWCMAVNFAILLFWALLLAFSPRWVHALHSRCLPIGEQHFYAIHYGGMMIYKLAIMMFNAVPWVALHIMGA